MRLHNRAALITGGTSGIGEATAGLFAEEGARVAIAGRSVERGEVVAERIRSNDGEAIFVQTDVRKADECRGAVEQTVEAFGRLDVLFNNAGVYVANDTVGCSEDEWDDQVDTSLKGAFLMSKFALPHMIEAGSGSIVNCASGWGLIGGAKAVAYCAAKGGMVVMTKAMAIDHGPQGIRVNAVCRGTPTRRWNARMRVHKGSRGTSTFRTSWAAGRSSGWRPRKRSRERCSSWRATSPPSSRALRSLSTAAAPPADPRWNSVQLGSWAYPVLFRAVRIQTHPRK